MNAHPILLQKKYTRIVEQFAGKAGITLDEALSFFYHSQVYKLVSEGVSDMHCMSDGYLVEDLLGEYHGSVSYDRHSNAGNKKSL